MLMCMYVYMYVAAQVSAHVKFKVELQVVAFASLDVRELHDHDPQTLTTLNPKPLRLPDDPEPVSYSTPGSNSQ